MSKYFKFLGLAMIIVGLMAGSAFAITNIQNAAGNPSTTIAKEIIDPAAGYIHNASGQIQFDVEAGGIAVGKKLVVSLGNATFENINTLKVCQGIVPIIPAPSVTTTDKTRAEFTAAVAIAPGADYYFAETCLISSTLVLKIASGATSVSATVATDDTAQTNPSATNANLYKAEQQFAMIAGGGDVLEVIDVDKDLLKFVPENNWNVVNTETVAYYDNNSVGFTAQNNALDLKAIIITNVNVNFEVTGKMAGVSSSGMKLIDTKATNATADDADIATFTIDAVNNKATASMKLSDLIAKWAAIKLTVDGTTPLEDRNLSINAKLSAADDVKVATTLIDGTATTDTTITPGGLIAAGKEKFIFEINGMQFVAPYVRQDSVVSSAIRLENAANRDSKVWVFVNNGGTWALAKRYDLLKGDKLVLGGQTIIDDAKTIGITLDGIKGFALWGIVKGTPGDNKNVTVYGSQQMVSGSFRPLPIQVSNPFGFSWME